MAMNLPTPRGAAKIIMEETSNAADNGGPNNFNVGLFMESPSNGLTPKFASFHSDDGQCGNATRFFCVCPSPNFILRVHCLCVVVDHASMSWEPEITTPNSFLQTTPGTGGSFIVGDSPMGGGRHHSSSKVVSVSAVCSKLCDAPGRSIRLTDLHSPGGAGLFNSNGGLNPQAFGSLSAVGQLSQLEDAAWPSPGPTPKNSESAGVTNSLKDDPDPSGDGAK